MEINQPVNEEVFRVVPPVGTNVVDESGAPLDVEGHGIDFSGSGLPFPQGRVEYKQPANSAEIPEAIKKGMAVYNYPDAPALRENPTGRRISIPFRWMIVANAALLLIASGYFVWRRMSS